MKQEELFSVIAFCLIIVTSVILFGRGFVLLGSIVLAVIGFSVMLIAWAIDNIPSYYFTVIGLLLGVVMVRVLVNELPKGSYLAEQIMFLEPIMVILSISCVLLLIITEIKRIFNRRKIYSKKKEVRK